MVLFCVYFAAMFVGFLSPKSVVGAASTTSSVTIDTALYNDLGITIRNNDNDNNMGGKILDGQVAPVGKYPTFVALDNAKGQCGAVLIWPDIVMSAASCERAIDTLEATVQIGSTIHNNETSSNAMEKIRVKNYFQHPLYRYVFGYVARNDIMLVILENTSNITASPYNTNPVLPVDGQNAAVVGYGRPYGDTSAVLREATVTTTSAKNCFEEFAGNQGILCSNETFCAKRNTGVPCTIDNGGPLFDPSTGAVVGIVGLSDYGCSSNQPNGFARVSTFAPWIRDIICKYSAVKTSGCPLPPPPSPPRSAPASPTFAATPLAPTAPFVVAAPTAPAKSPTSNNTTTNTTNTTSSSPFKMTLRSKDSSSNTNIITSSKATDNGVCVQLEDVSRPSIEGLFCSDPSDDDDGLAPQCYESETNHMHQIRFIFFCRDDCVDQNVVNRKRLFGWKCGPCPKVYL